MASKEDNFRYDNSSSSLDLTTMGHQATSTLEASDAPSGSVTSSVNRQTQHRPRLQSRDGEGGFQLAPRGKYNTANEYSLPDGHLRYSTSADNHATQTKTIALQWSGISGDYGATTTI